MILFLCSSRGAKLNEAQEQYVRGCVRERESVCVCVRETVERLNGFVDRPVLEAKSVCLSLSKKERRA